jgi:hypothetical protein
MRTRVPRCANRCGARQCNTPIHGALETRPDERPTDAGVFYNWVAYTRALKSAGALVALERLQGSDTATTVRLPSGEPLLPNGPFIEPKEHLLGLSLVEVADLDAAIEWAASAPPTRHGTVEVRPVRPLHAEGQAAVE